MMCCYWPMTYLKNDPKLRQNMTCVESGERFDKEATSYVSGDRPERNEEGGCNHMTQYYSGDDSSREHARPHTEPGADMQDDIHEIRVESYDTYPGARGSDRPRQEEE